MADHSSFLQMARDMIREEGREVTFYKLSSTPSDVTKPWRGPTNPTLLNPVEVFAVFVPHFGESEFGRTIADADLFKSVDQVLLVAPPTSGEDLEGYHLVDDGGSKWRIEIIRTLKPASLVVLYAVGVCR